MKLWKLRYFTSFSGGSLLIGVIFFLLYAFSAPRVNVGYSDSDQLLAVAYHWGVAHPPGYPLYISLLWVVMHLPWGISPVLSGHLLSSVFGALTLSVIFRATWKVIRTLRGLSHTPLISTQIDTFILSFGATAALGISSLFWIYSIVAEVFSFHAFFVSLVIYRMIISLTTQRTLTPRWWIWSAVIWGLGLGHHQTLILLFPAWLVSIFMARQSLSIHLGVRMIAALVISFVLPFTLLLGMARSGAPVSWDMADGMPGLVKHMFRQSFSGTNPETGQSTSAYLPRIDIDSIIELMPTYAQESVRFWGIVPLILVLIGIKTLSTNQAKLLTVLLIGWLISGPIFAGILGWPNHFGTQANIQRQTIMGYIFLPLFIASGWFFLMQRLRKAGEILSNNHRIGGFVIIIFFGASLLYHFFTTYPYVNMRHFTAFYDEYSTMLDEFGENALVVCFTDPSCFMFHYAQAVEGKRPDITIIPRAKPLVASTLASRTDLRKFVYADEPFITFDYVTWNLDKRPVYVVDISEMYYHLLGINQAFTYYIPRGYYGELTRTVPEKTLIPRYDITEATLEMPISLHDRMRVYYLSNLSRIHQLHSTLMVKLGERALAREELNVAGNLNEKIVELVDLDLKFEDARRSIESSQPDPQYKAGKTPIAFDDIKKLIPQWKEKRRLDVAHKMALAGITIYPENIEARLLAAGSFEEIGDKRAAIEEYQNTLILDPTNASAAAALERLTPSENKGLSY